MPLTRKQAFEYYRSDDLIGLGMEADMLRRRLHPENVVTYILDRKISYPCLPRNEGASARSDSPLGDESSFERPDGGPKQDSTLDIETVCRQIAETIEQGGTGVVFEGAADVEIPHLERLLKAIRQRFPQISLDCFSAPEILAMATHSNLSIRDTLARLREAGLNSIAGSGAGILNDDVRPGLAQQCSTDDWLKVHRIAHQLGIRTTAAMTFGMGETFEDRLRYLEEIRRLQEETGGFVAFFPSNFQPNNARPLGGNGQQGSSKYEEATAVEYLKVLAIARLYLDTIENVQCSWAAQGLKALQLSLRFGGNDAGSVMLSQTPFKGARTSNSTTEEQLRHTIRGAGFKPVQRDALYTVCFLN